MKSNTRQLVWGGITLVVMLGSFRTFDQVQRKRAERHLVAAEMAVTRGDVAKARKELEQVDRRIFVSDGAIADLEHRINRLNPQVKDLEDRTLFDERLAVLADARALAVHGNFAAAQQALGEVADTGGIANEEIRQQFEAMLAEANARIGRVQAAMQNPALPEFETPMSWQALSAELQELMALDERIASAAENRWIGSDKKSLRAKKQKRATAFFEAFRAEMPLVKLQQNKVKKRAALQEDIAEMLVARETAPESKGKFSLKTTRADYDEKIQAARDVLVGLDVQFDEAGERFLVERGASSVVDLGEKPYAQWEFAAFVLKGFERLDALEQEGGAELAEFIAAQRSALAWLWGEAVAPLAGSEDPALRAVAAASLEAADAPKMVAIAWYWLRDVMVTQ